MTKEINERLRFLPSRTMQSRLCPTILVLLLAVAFAAWYAPASPVWAQADDETLDDGLAEPDATSSDAATPADSDAPPKERSLLDTLIDGGFVGVLILLLSMVAVGFVVEHALTIRKSVLSGLRHSRTGRIDQPKPNSLHPFRLPSFSQYQLLHHRIQVQR